MGCLRWLLEDCDNVDYSNTWLCSSQQAPRQLYRSLLYLCQAVTCTQSYGNQTCMRHGLLGNQVFILKKILAFILFREGSTESELSFSVTPWSHPHSYTFILGSCTAPLQSLLQPLSSSLGAIGPCSSARSDGIQVGQAVPATFTAQINPAS